MTTTMKGIPVLHVEADCIARAWELSLIELHQKGCDVRTEYDKPEDPPSKDATMFITIADPLTTSAETYSTENTEEAGFVNHC
jgi:thymidylate synthase